jgi:mannose-1-phosphate guanylyltransferase
VSLKPRNTWVVILAGGEGRRLSSLTSGGDGRHTPKQYCSLNGGASLLQLALRRALAVTTQDRIFCIVNDAHRHWWEPQLAGLKNGIVVQPVNRGTALGVLLPLLVIAKADPRGGVLCLPSDHHVEHEDVLAESLRQATTAAAYDTAKITLLGMPTNAPDTGFGYLLGNANPGVAMRPLRHFVEKPDETLAAQLLRQGALWNSGMFSGSIERLVELFPRWVPGMMLDLKSIVEYWRDIRHPSAELACLYARHPCVDFSWDVLQKRPDSLQLLEVPPCGWSDVGTPSRLAKTLWSLKPRNTGANVASTTRTFSLMRALNLVNEHEPRSLARD